MPAAYGVLHHHFFDSGFIEMLMVAERFRRRGLGEVLLQHLVASCTRPRLFTSTNQSNQPMRALLARTGFINSGHIDNLDIPLNSARRKALAAELGATAQ